MDAGIINTFKAKYKKIVAKLFLKTAHETQAINLLTVKCALYSVENAWDEISVTIINNCWNHAWIVGIINKDVGEDNLKSSEKNQLDRQKCVNELVELLDRLKSAYYVYKKPGEIIEILEPEELIDIENEKIISDFLTNKDILDLIKNISEDEQDKTDESEMHDALPRVSHIEANGHLDAVERYFEESTLFSSEDVDLIQRARQSLETTKDNSLKQSK